MRGARRVDVRALGRARGRPGASARALVRLTAQASHATLWAYVRHPHELVALVRFKLAQDTLPRIPDGLTPEQRYCYEKLVQVRP